MPLIGKLTLDRCHVKSILQKNKYSVPSWGMEKFIQRLRRIHMARTIKTDAQKAHEARNKAAKSGAKKARTAARKAGLKAFAEHNKQMKITASANKLRRISAHLQRNAALASEAAARKAERAAANDNKALAQSA